MAKIIIPVAKTVQLIPSKPQKHTGLIIGVFQLVLAVLIDTI